MASINQQNEGAAPPRRAGSHSSWKPGREHRRGPRVHQPVESAAPEALVERPTASCDAAQMRPMAIWSQIRVKAGTRECLRYESVSGALSRALNCLPESDFLPDSRATFHRHKTTPKSPIDKPIQRTRAGSAFVIYHTGDRWCHAGAQQPVFTALTTDRDNQYPAFDTAVIRAHQQAATGNPVRLARLRRRVWTRPRLRPRPAARSARPGGRRGAAARPPTGRWRRLRHRTS